MRQVIETVTDLTSCDVLYIGGGNARKIAFELPAHVTIVSNTAGITGGIRLWEPELDELFRGEPDWRRRTRARGSHEGPDRRRRHDRYDRHHRQRSHRAHEHDQRRQLLPAAGGGAQDRGAGDLHPRRRRRRQRRRGHGAARARRGDARQARQGCARRDGAGPPARRRACRRAGPCATGARRRVPRCWSPRTTATPPSSPSAAPTRCWRRRTCARRRLPPIWSTSPRSATSRRTPFPPSSSGPRRKARWWRPTRACASCPRAAAPSRTRWRRSTFWRSIAPRPTCWCRASSPASAKAARRLPLKPGEQLPRLAVRGFAGGGHEMSLVGFFAALRQLGPALRRGHRWARTAPSWAPRRRSCIARCWRPRSRGPRAPAMPSTPRLPPVWRWAGPREEALRAAAINAASVVGHVDTQTGLLSPRGDRQAPRRDKARTLEVRIWSH